MNTQSLYITSPSCGIGADAAIIQKRYTTIPPADNSVPPFNQLLSILTYFQFHVWKFIEIRGIVDRADLHWNRGWSLPDVLPIHAAEERCQLKLFDTSLRT